MDEEGELSEKIAFLLYFLAGIAFCILCYRLGIIVKS